MKHCKNDRSFIVQSFRADEVLLGALLVLLFCGEVDSLCTNIVIGIGIGRLLHSKQYLDSLSHSKQRPVISMGSVLVSLMACILVATSVL